MKINKKDPSQTLLKNGKEVIFVPKVWMYMNFLKMYYYLSFKFIKFRFLTILVYCNNIGYFLLRIVCKLGFDFLCFFRMQGHKRTLLKCVSVRAYTWVSVKVRYLCKNSSKCGLCPGRGPSHRLDGQALSCQSVSLCSELNISAGKNWRSTVSSHLPLSHRHYKQTTEVCQKPLYIKHFRHQNGGQTQ